MNSDRITDKIASRGKKGFYFTENNHFLLHHDINDKNITFLSIGQTVNFKLCSNNMNGKEGRPLPCLII